MNIGIDIRPLMSPIRTGVGEYTYELLNALFKIDNQNQYFYFIILIKILNKTYRLGILKIFITLKIIGQTKFLTYAKNF